MRCLLLRLEGPLMAFGDVAVDEIRPTRSLPTRSMLTGLLANALGLDHCEVEALQGLQERLRFAARAERPGRFVVDFQTAEIAKRDPLWTTRTAPAERAGGEQSYTGPVIRHRHYIADASICLALTLFPPDEPPSLDEVATALTRPARPLFLGRKSCPPAVRILERPPFEAGSLVDALGLGDGSIEVDDLEGEPVGRRTFTVADLRDWRFGFHTGTRRVREVPARSAGDGG